MKSREDFMIELIENLKVTNIDFEVVKKDKDISKNNCISGEAYCRGLTFYFVINKNKQKVRRKHMIVYGLGVNKNADNEVIKQFEHFKELLELHKDSFDFDYFIHNPEDIETGQYGGFEVGYNGADWYYKRQYNVAEWPEIIQELTNNMSSFIKVLKPFIKEIYARNIT